MRIRSHGAVLGAFLFVAAMCVSHAVWAEDPPPGGYCTSDAECDDGLFCNGRELCAPGAEGSDARGCIDPIDGPPCQGERLTCDEGRDRCEVTCDGPEDADGDGHDSIECGGDDCDDNDGSRYPGNVEICDEEGHDEDCDPGTYNSPVDGDADGDGFVDFRCWNDLRQGGFR